MFSTQQFHHPNDHCTDKNLTSSLTAKSTLEFYQRVLSGKSLKIV